MRRTCPRLLAILLLTVLAAPPGRAASVSASASSYEAVDSETHPSAATALVARVGPNAPGSSTAAASAGLGGLAVTAKTVGCGFEINNFQQVCNQAGSQGSLLDTVLVQAAVPNGTAVQFRLTLDLNGTIDGIGGYNYQAVAHLNLVSQAFNGSTGGTVQTFNGLSMDGVRVWNVTVYVGTAYQLGSSLQASVFNRYCAGGSGDCVPSATTWEINLNASSTLRVELLTTGLPNVRLVGRQGHDYLTTPLAVGEPVAPAARLGPPVPHPARGAVSFALDLATATAVDIGVYDLAGRRVATLNGGELAAGTHTLRWDGRDATGRERSGMYFVKARGAGLEAARRVLIVR